jgi:hypothetical protein
MDSQDILQHLLQVESAAAALVLDAQAEADRRIAAAEAAGRAAYDASYAAALAEHEAEYERLRIVAETEFNSALAAYRDELAARPAYPDQFRAALVARLFGGA